MTDYYSIGHLTAREVETALHLLRYDVYDKQRIKYDTLLAREILDEEVQVVARLLFGCCDGNQKAKDAAEYVLGCFSEATKNKVEPILVRQPGPASLLNALKFW